MIYIVELSPQAEKFYTHASLALAKKLARCFLRLEQDPRNYPNIKPLKGDLAGYFRYRVGDYRVIYTIDDEQKRVFIVAIAHRSDAY